MAGLPLALGLLRRHGLMPALDKPHLVCLGCGCTDDRACAGGCSWEQPGICTQCAPRTEKLLLRSSVADRLVRARAASAMLVGRTSFSIMSLALLSLVGDEREATEHRERLAEGALLKPFTSVRMGKTCWTFDLVYRAPQGEPAAAYRLTWRIRMGSGKSKP